MKKAIAALGMTAAGIVMVAAPASAHSLTIYQGNDSATMGSAHLRLWAHDAECDSHSVRVYYKTQIMEQAGQAAKYFTDSNGCTAGDSVLETNDGGYQFATFRVCEYADESGTLSCSSWHDA